MEKIKYFVLGLLSILLVSYTTNNVTLFKPAKPVSVFSDCYRSKDLNEIGLFMKKTTTDKNISGFILKDFEIYSDQYGNMICLHFEKY